MNVRAATFESIIRSPRDGINNRMDDRGTRSSSGRPSFLDHLARMENLHGAPSPSRMRSATTYEVRSTRYRTSRGARSAR